MTNHSKQKQTETEATYQTFPDFLQNTPPNKLGHISNLVVQGDMFKSASTVHWVINAPMLELHCSDDLCNGARSFRCPVLPSERKPVEQDIVNYLYVKYQCSNCHNTLKIYSLAVKIDEIPRGTCYKLGEDPPYGPPISPKLIRLIQPDSDMFMQGRRCENQGFGIGAFAYYRRVVENQKNRILGEIVKVSEKMAECHKTKPIYYAQRLKKFNSEKPLTWQRMLYQKIY